MRTRSFHASALATLTLLGLSSQALAWGERGHHTVCEVATKLVTNTKQTGAFARFMLPKGHMMGHVCNLPDISWRSLNTPDGADDTIIDPRVGDEAHFINPENFTFKNDDGSPNTIAVPLNFRDVEKKAVEVLAAKHNTKQTPHQLTGSNWWRTQQLYSLAIDHGMKGLAGVKDLIGLEKAYDKDFKKLKKAEKDARADEIAARKAEVDKKKDYINTELRTMLISMGIMGHFVGDAGQPFHNSADYNGKESGHYGIHSYYESKIVDAIAADLPGEVYDSAQKDMADEKSALRAILATQDADPSYSGDKYNVIARMRQLSALAGVQMKTILETEESIPGFVKGELHKSKNPEGRPYADALESQYPEQYAKYRSMIVNEIGVSAKLLATFWDEIYATLDKRAKEISAELAADGSKPQYIELTKYYTTWDYPLDSPYIQPTYLVENTNDQSGPSLKALAAGLMAPPPALEPQAETRKIPGIKTRSNQGGDVWSGLKFLGRKIKGLFTNSSSDDEDEKELGEIDVDEHAHGGSQL
jgi:hypothetical protein